MGLRKRVLEKHMGRLWKLGEEQARIHTGFHRFAEISHIFLNIYMFNNKTHFSSWNPANILSEWLENPGKGTLRIKKSNTFPEGARHLTMLEACAFGVRLGSRSEFIMGRQEIHESEEISSRWCLRKRKIHGFEERGSNCDWRQSRLYEERSFSGRRNNYIVISKVASAKGTRNHWKWRKRFLVKLQGKP